MSCAARTQEEKILGCLRGRFQVRAHPNSPILHTVFLVPSPLSDSISK